MKERLKRFSIGFIIPLIVIGCLIIGAFLFAGVLDFVAWEIDNIPTLYDGIVRGFSSPSVLRFILFLCVVCGLIVMPQPSIKDFED